MISFIVLFVLNKKPFTWNPDEFRLDLVPSFPAEVMMVVVQPDLLRFRLLPFEQDWTEYLQRRQQQQPWFAEWS
jgi:hypothetical protein